MESIPCFYVKDHLVFHWCLINIYNKIKCTFCGCFGDCIRRVSAGVVGETKKNAIKTDVKGIVALRMIYSPYCTLSRVCLHFRFVSCKPSQNANISQLLTFLE